LLLHLHQFLDASIHSFCLTVGRPR